MLVLALSTSVASADTGRDRRNAENTMTKWITAAPGVPPLVRNMVGIVGGDVGDGTFTRPLTSAARPTPSAPLSMSSRPAS
jgi:hypothetical protein